MISPTGIPLPTSTPPPTPTPLPTVRIHTAEKALFNGDWETALAEFQAAMSNSEEPQVKAEALLGSARSYLMGRNEYEAITLLETLITDYPQTSQSATAHFFLAQAFERQERFGEAALQYQFFLEKKPGAIHGYIRDRLGDALLSSGDHAGAVIEYETALEAESVLDEIQLRLKLARAYTLTGDGPTALALYDDVFNRTNSDYTRAQINLLKGQIFSDQGQMDQAYEVYLDAVNNYPKSYDSYTALVELVNAGITVDELQRGIVDYYAGQYGPAMAAFDHYLQNNPVDPGTARYYYGQTQAAQGNYEAAIRQWDALISDHDDHTLWDEAWEMKAYTQWANLDRFPEAINTLTQFVEKAPGHPRAAEFLFDAALAAERDQKFTKAIELWEQQAVVYPNDERTTRSRFLSALTYYRLANYSAAADAFRRFSAVAVTLEEKASGHFWIGKSLNAVGDVEGARSAWETGASIDPTGYYSERARDQLHQRDPFDPPQSYDLGFDIRTERIKAEDWMRTTFNIPLETDLSGPAELVNDPYLRRGLELWELGLFDEARGEFEVLRQYAADDPIKTYRLVNLFLELGAYRPAIMAARQVLDLAGLSETATLNAPAFFNHIRFGGYYSEIVMPLAQEYGFHPLVLFALIRQESLFEGFVRSSAGARGLMQIIPRTGEEIAANLGWPVNYNSEDLYRPLVSLTLGVDYLDSQRKNFEGDLFAALAAYNGGPGNAAQWIQSAQEDPDLFMELIPYAETRTYIRRIYENFTIYRLLYAREQ